jgi:hypothetical protein
MSESRDRATIAEDMRELCRGKMRPSDRRLLTTAADSIDVDGELAAVLTAEIARLRQRVDELEKELAAMTDKYHEETWQRRGSKKGWNV